MDIEKFRDCLNDSVAKLIHGIGPSDDIGRNKIVILHKFTIPTYFISNYANVPTVEGEVDVEGVIGISISDQNSGIGVGIYGNDLRLMALASKFLRKNGLPIQLPRSINIFFNAYPWLNICLPPMLSEQMAYDYYAAIGDLIVKLKKLDLPLAEGGCEECGSHNTMYFPRLCEGDISYMAKSYFVAIRDTLKIPQVIERSTLKVARNKILKIILDLKDFKVLKNQDATNTCRACGHLLLPTNSSVDEAIDGLRSKKYSDRFWMEPNLCSSCGNIIDWVTIQLQVENSILTYKQIADSKFKDFRGNT